jgi:hypothetical protein
VSGAIAGASQSVLSTPVDRIMSRLKLETWDSRKHSLLHHIQTHNVFLTPPKTTTTPHSLASAFKFYSQVVFPRVALLYSGFYSNMVRDTLSFSVFFGTFESVRSTTKKIISEEFDHKPSFLRK